MHELIPAHQEKPAIPVEWDYNNSVERMRGAIYKWRDLTDEMLHELWVAYNKLSDPSNAGRPSKSGENSTNNTWTRYCEDIGVDRKTPYNWFRRAGFITSGAHVSNNTGNQENYTPPVVIEAVKDVMETIDLDPASNDTANEIVGASSYYTVEDNSLEKPWGGRVFLNPPYQQPEIRLFTEKLISELPNIEEAIVLVNNNTDTRWFHALALQAAAICFTAGRIRFYTTEKEETQPTNGQAFFYFGDRVERFSQRFSQSGIIMRVWNDTQ